MTTETTYILQIIGGIAVFITAVGALITSLRTNRKIKITKAEEENIRAGAAQKIVDAATASVQLLHEEANKARTKLLLEQAESEKWKNHCELLDEKVIVLTKRVSENETCQSKLTGLLAEQQGKLDDLEQEKRRLMNRVIDLESKLETANEKINALQEENKRLKEERNNEKVIIA